MEIDFKDNNLTKYDYYLFVFFSYLGAFGALISFFAAIWIMQYRWQLFATAFLCIFLNWVSEESIKA